MRIFRRESVLCVRDSPECHQTNSRKLSCWDLADGSALSLTLVRFSLPRLSYPSPGFIFMYLLLRSIARARAMGSGALSGAAERTNRGYVSLCIIHRSVDPEGCWSSNKCCLCVTRFPFSAALRVYEFTFPRRTLRASRRFIHSRCPPPLCLSIRSARSNRYRVVLS